MRNGFNMARGYGRNPWWSNRTGPTPGRANRPARFGRPPPPADAAATYLGHNQPKTPAVSSPYTSPSNVFLSDVLHLRFHQIESCHSARA